MSEAPAAAAGAGPPGGNGAAAARGPRRLRGVLWGVGFGLAGGALLVAATLAGALRHLPPLPVLGTLPPFAFEDQAGRPLSERDLDGKIWVVDFFFARCRGICPMLAERMKEVDRYAQSKPDLAARTRLLSITVDPEHDDARVLAQYAAAHRIDGDRWRLATGRAPQVLEVVTRAFRIAVEPPTTDPKTGDLDILHGGYLVVVDPARRIRGYFDSDADGVRRLEQALSALAAEEQHR